MKAYNSLHSLALTATRLLRNQLIKKHPIFQGCATCPDRLPSLRDRLGNLPIPSFPVDVVYTWVDGTDTKLASKREAYLPPQEKRLEESQGNSLYRDNEELRYSLRSLEAYAPWVRRVFIVTDGQVPSWLNTGHKKICIVDHKEFIPNQYLPTFNSRVIEAHLQRIPGLAEHYIYFNDDFFLSSQCTPGDFFTPNGLPFLFTDWRLIRLQGYLRADSPHSCSFHNVRDYLKKYGINPVPYIITAHAPYPQTIQNATDAYTFYEESILAFSQNKFRTTKDMAFNCHAAALWAYAQKRAVPCDTPYYYINAKRFDRYTYYETMLHEKDTGTLPLFLCLNDVGEVTLAHTWRKDMTDFLENFFPQVSTFEHYNIDNS